MTGVALATEDELSESVGVKLLTGVGITPSILLRRNGFGYLRANMPKWCKMASTGLAVVLIADLDRGRCAPSLIDLWYRDQVRPKNLVFRVAEREVESWLIADEAAMCQLLGNRAKIPQDPDLLPDPKQALINLARSASRSVREELVAPTGTIASQGLGYNRTLCALVRDHWDPTRASRRSRSLASALSSIKELAKRVA